MPAAKRGRERPRRGPGTARRPGPLSRLKNWVEVWFGQHVVPGHECRFDRVGAAAGRRRQQAALGAEEVHVEFRTAASAAGLRRRPSSWPVCGSAWTVPVELDVGREAVGGEDQAVAVRPAAGRRGRSRRGSAPGSAALVDRRASRSSSTPGSALRLGCRSGASRSVQATLPSAALGLIEKPSGRVTVAALISRGRRRRSGSRLRHPEVDVEARGGVGLARRRLAPRGSG